MCDEVKPEILRHAAIVIGGMAVKGVRTVLFQFRTAALQVEDDPFRNFGRKSEAQPCAASGRGKIDVDAVTVEMQRETGGGEPESSRIVYADARFGIEQFRPGLRQDQEGAVIPDPRTRLVGRPDAVKTAAARREKTHVVPVFDTPMGHRVRRPRQRQGIAGRVVKLGVAPLQRIDVVEQSGHGCFSTLIRPIWAAQL